MPSQNEIEAMVIRILGDSSVFQKAIDQAERAAKNLSATEKELTRTEKARAAAMEEGKRVTRAVETSTERYSREVKELNMLLKRGAISQQTFTRAVKQGGQEYRNAGNSLKSLGQGMRGAGTKMTLGVTLPLVGIGLAAVKTGADLDSAFIGVKKTVDGTANELAKVRQELEDLGTSGGVAVDLGKMFNTAEIGGQLGIARDNIDEFTKTAVDMEVSTNLSAEESGTALARIANITGLSQQKFQNLGSSIVALGNTTATTERDIVAMTLRLSGAGAQVGLSVPQITALAASLSSVGIEAEAGGTAFSQLMLNISKEIATGGKNLDAFARVAGQTAEKFSESFRKDTAGAITDLLEGLNNLDSEAGIKALDDMGIQGIRMTDALLRSSKAVDLLKTSMKTSEDAFNKGTALAEEASKRYESFKGQLVLLRNELSIVASQIFTEVKPAILAMVEGIKDVVKWFSNLPPSVKATTIVIGLLAAAAGPLLIAFGAIVGGVANVILAYSSFKIAQSVMRDVGASSTAMAAEVGASSTTMAGSTASTSTAMIKWNASTASSMISLAGTATTSSASVTAAEAGMVNAIRQGHSVIFIWDSKLAISNTTATKAIAFNYLSIGTAANTSALMIEAASIRSIRAIESVNVASMIPTKLGVAKSAATSASTTAPVALIGMSKASKQAAESGIIIDAVYKKVSTSTAVVASTSATAATKLGMVARAAMFIDSAAVFLLSSLKRVFSFFRSISSVITKPIVLVTIAFAELAGKGDSFAEKLSSSMAVLGNLFSTVWYGVAIPALNAGGVAFDFVADKVSTAFKAISETVVGAFILIREAIGSGVKAVIGWGEWVAATITGDKEWNGWIMANVEGIHQLNKALGKSSELTNNVLEGNEKRFTEQLDVAVNAGDTKGLDGLRARVSSNLDGISSLVAEKSKALETIGGGPFRKVAEDELKHLQARETQLKEHLTRVEEALKSSAIPGVGGAPSSPEKPGGETSPDVPDIDQKSIDETLKGLRAKLDSFGADPVILGLKLSGAAEEEIAQAQAMLDELKAAQATKDVEDLTKSFQDQAAVIGMSANQARIYAFELENIANPEAIEAAKEALAKLDEAVDAEKMKKKGEQLMKELATPMEKFKAKEAELIKLKDLGFIDDKTFKAGIKKAKDELDGIKEKVDKDLPDKEVNIDFKSQGIEGIQSGTADALARIMEHRDQLESIGVTSDRVTPSRESIGRDEPPELPVGISIPQEAVEDFAVSQSSTVDPEQAQFSSMLDDLDLESVGKPFEEESRMLEGVDRLASSETKDEATDLLRRLVELEEAKVDNVVMLESAGL